MFQLPGVRTGTQRGPAYAVRFGAIGMAGAAAELLPPLFAMAAETGDLGLVAGTGMMAVCGAESGARVSEAAEGGTRRAGAVRGGGRGIVVRR